MALRLLFLTFILLSVAMPTVSYYCSDYSSNGSSIQFTDSNPSNVQVKEIGGSATLLCCAANYNSTVWYFKDEKYPNWDLPSHVIRNNIKIYQQGQELRITATTFEMDGQYMCVITDNDGHSLNFTQTMWVKPLHQSGYIVPVHDKRCTDQSATNGVHLTFYCNFFVGQSEICPSLIWVKNDSGETYIFGYEYVFGPYSNFTTFVIEQDECTEGDISTQGSALHIYNVSDDAKGIYCITLVREISVTVCLNLSIIKEDKQGDKQAPGLVYRGNEENTIIAIVPCVLVICILVFIIFYLKFKLDFRLFYKKHIAKKETSDGKIFDAFISHSNSDEDIKFVLDQLRPFLVDTLKYKVCIDEINFEPGADHANKSVNAVSLSRRCILVLSSDYIERQYCLMEFIKALEELRLRKHIIPIMFRDIPPERLNNHEALQHVIKAGDVLKWETKSHCASTNGKNIFWKKLEVAMPQSQTNSTSTFMPSRSLSKDSAVSLSTSDMSVMIEGNTPSGGEFFIP